MINLTINTENIEQSIVTIRQQVAKHKEIRVTSEKNETGNWGMARLWRKWMAQTADFMAANGVTMPLMFDKNGEQYGKRAFNEYDAHELFTSQWLLLDGCGERLSWSKNGRDGMKPASKGDRFLAMQKHEAWAVERGINLLQPRDSEYQKLKTEQEK